MKTALRIMIVAVSTSVGLSASARAQDQNLNLRNVELPVFVELVSQQTGRNFILDPRVSGTVTIFAPEAIEEDELFEIFLNVLELNRFTIIESGEVDRIVPAQLARELSAEDRQTADHGFATHAIPVENIDLTEAAEIITPLIPQEAVLTPYPGGNLLILSDRVENIKRITRLIRRLDAAPPAPVEIVNMRNASAGVLVETLRALELTSSGAKLSVDKRANALLVSGSESFRLQVRSLVAELDKPQTITDAKVLRLEYADAQQVAAIGEKLLVSPGGQGEGATAAKIVADETTNSVLISAPPDVLNSLVNAVKKLDRRPAQVLVEGVIFEMSAEKFAQLGSQFGGVINDVFVGGVQFNVGGVPTLGSLVTTLLGNNVPTLANGLNLAAVGGDRSSVGLLTALARDTSTNILSTPSLLTLDNEEAEITVAENVPFVTGSFSTVGESAIPNQPFQTIQRQDVGLTLNVLPQISGEGTVRMRVQQEVSNLTTAAAASGGEITQRRAINTSIIIGDGRLVLLGGLMEDFSSSTQEKVPWLGDVPIIKKLFSSKGKNETKRVLLLLLRPTIIRNDRQASQATDLVYGNARTRQTKLARELDDDYPSGDVAGLPPTVPSLSAPFQPSGTVKSSHDKMLPSLGGRLKLKRR